MKNKNITRILMILLILGIFISAFVGCEPAKPSETDIITTTSEQETDVPKKSYIFAENGESNYKIIYPIQSDDNNATDANSVKNTFSLNANVEIDVSTDMYNTSLADYKFPENEILVGKTNRPESTFYFDTLKYDDYVIAVSNGKLVIIGGSGSATSRAVAEFHSLVKSDKVEFEEGEVLRYTKDYDIKSLTVNGKDISEFTVIYPSREIAKYSDAADIIIAAVQKAYGITLISKADVSADEAAYEIVLGDCSANAYNKMPELNNIEYCIYSAGNKVFLDAGAGYSMSLAAGAFVSTYIPSDAKGEVSINPGSDATVQELEIRTVPLASGSTTRVMSNNILANDTLKNRASILNKIYMDYFPDIIGLQECNSNGHSMVVKPLLDYYTVACLKVANTTVACYTPILYRTDKYNLLEGGAEFNDKRYEGTNTKSMAWAVLEEIATGQKIIVINIHCSLITDSYNLAPMTNAVEGAAWREDNSRQMLEKAAELKNTYGANTPLFIMGDLNAVETATSIRMLEEVYDNAISVATISSSTGTASFHTVGESPSSSRLPIDHIFVDSASVTVYTHFIKTDKEAIDSSDHCQLFIDVSYK